MGRPAIHGAGADCALMVKRLDSGAFFLGVISNKFFCNFLNSFLNDNKQRGRERESAKEKVFWAG